MTVHYETDGPVAIVTIDRPEVANAVDGETAGQLVAAFQRFDEDPDLTVAILTGAGSNFSAGGDLKAMMEGRGITVSLEGTGPLGPTRMFLSKPVISAVEGHAVAGGLELRLWCDLRVAARDATFGVYCRRWEQWDVELSVALRRESELGLAVIGSGETMKGIGRWRSGEWSYSEFADA